MIRKFAQAIILMITTQYSLGERFIRVRNSCPNDGWIIVTDGYGSSHPDLSSYRVNSSATAEFVWSDPSDDSEVVWSGNLAMCLNGTCGPSEEDCDSGECFISEGGPLTRAEFTLLTTVDYYDLSIINGANVPASITPLGDFAIEAEDPYWCGNPGGAVPISDGAPGSSWAFDPPFSPYYTWVLAGGSPCASSSDCAGAGEECGLANNIGSSPQFSLSCGTPVGHWTADQVCGADISMGFPFNCSEPMSNGPNPGADTMWTYLGCTDGISSCYSAGAPETCCGCFDWWSDWDLPISPAPATTACENVNSEWQATAGTTLVFLKAACPTCYTYPYDDVSSTFLCSSSSKSQDLVKGRAKGRPLQLQNRHEEAFAVDSNGINYEVEFCPAAILSGGHT